MTKILLAFFMLSLSSLIFAKNSSTVVSTTDSLSVFVEYRHGSVHVHYPLPCSYGVTSTLSSPEGAPTSWRVEVTPKDLGNDLVSVLTVVRENDEEISRFEVINKIGEKAKITSTGPEEDKMELTVHPKHEYTVRIPKVDRKLNLGEGS